MPQPPLPEQTWRTNETHCHDDKLMSETRIGVAPLWDRGGMTNDSTVRANAPGKSFRKAMTLAETTREFPDDVD